MSLLSPSSALHRAVVGLFQFVLRGKVLALVTVVICAFFAARTVSSLVEAEVLLPTANAAPPPVKRTAPSGKPTANPNVISERNIFCSTCEPEISYANYQGQPAVLIATSVADSGRRATVRVLPTDVQGSWGLDETIPGVGKITRIGGTSIDVVDDGNHQKTISLLDAVAAGAPGAATPGAPDKSTDPFASRVRKINDTTYEVDRSVVSELMASAGQGAGAQAMPVLDKGEVKGLRLLRVKPTSVAAAIGLKSNDILAAIDGDQIKTMQGVLDAIAKVDTAKQMSLQGTRGGKPLEVTLKFH